MKIPWTSYTKVRTMRGRLCCVQTSGSGQLEGIFIELTHDLSFISPSNSLAGS